LIHPSAQRSSGWTSSFFIKKAEKSSIRKAAVCIRLPAKRMHPPGLLRFFYKKRRSPAAAPLRGWMDQSRIVRTLSSPPGRSPAAARMDGVFFYKIL
jgi:hypothetical protein